MNMNKEYKKTPDEYEYNLNTLIKPNKLAKESLYKQ